MNDTFVNPYTFIPVEKCSKKEYHSYFDDKELLTGKISCTLTARTQLSVCDYGDNNTKSFYSVDGIHPVIPGSGLRGTLRSVYETLTDACLSVVNAEDDDFFSSRMKKKDTGLLSVENGEYVLYKAERCMDNKNIGKKYKTSDRVFITTYEKSNRKYITKIFDESENINDSEGYFLRVNFMKNNFPSVFVKGKRVGVVNDVYIQRLERNVYMYLKYSKDKQIAENYEEAFDNMKKGKTMLPVWYCYENGHYYFAPSQISRSVFYNRPVDLIEKAGAKKCSDKEHICDACSLFGTVNDKQLTVPSRLRFSDAVSTAEYPFEGPYVLPILSNPRLSSFEFYLRNPNPKYGADDNGTTFSGRKYYWHNNRANYTQNCESKNENMQYKVQLAKKGTVFTFDIFFEKITEEQLRKLLFTINLGENDADSNKCHKIGHGKPIGLGSAKIVVDSVTIRSYENGEYTEQDVTQLAKQDNRELFTDKKTIENVLRVTDFNAIRDGNCIGYPAETEGGDIFKWFANNRKTFQDGSTKYKQKLPVVSSNSQSLIRQEPKNKYNNSYNNNRYRR